MCAVQGTWHTQLLSMLWWHWSRSRGRQAPQNLEWGTLMQIAPPDFVIGTKRSILWPSKYAKIRFLRYSPYPLVGCGGDTPPHTLTTLGTDSPSAITMRPPEFQPDLRIYFRAVKWYVQYLIRTDIKQECPPTNGTRPVLVMKVCCTLSLQTVLGRERNVVH